MRKLRILKSGVCEHLHMLFFKRCIGIMACLMLLSTLGCQDVQDRLGDTAVSVTPDDIVPHEPGIAAPVFTDTPGDAFGVDPYVLNSATITADTLEVNVSYGGGCEAHVFTLIVSEAFLESAPVQLNISLAHIANGDACEAWLTETYRFDLLPIKQVYQAGYGSGAGTVVLRLADAPDGQLVYTFDE